MSFSRKPEAPARSAPKTYSSSSKVVSTITRVPASVGSAVSRAVAAQAVHARHPHVHQHDVGPVRPRELDRLLAVGGLGDDRDVVLAVEQRAEAGAHHRLVVGEQDRDHAGRPRVRAGSVASTRQPPLGAGPASSVPPSAAARSRIPRTPLPEPPSPGRRPAPSSTHLDADLAAVARDGRPDACDAPAWRSTFVSASCTIR